MGDKSKKLVKVDNWGMFFLQRLQQHYHRDEFCDFTLQFRNKQQVKAHRLVLDVCTEYFQGLEKQGLVNGECISMPEDMQPDVVIPVINFMYTGRLEFRTEIQTRLYLTAQKMKMTVLTKLLDAQTSSMNAATPIQHANIKSKGSPLVRAPLKNSGSTVFSNTQPKIIRRVDTSLPQMLPGRKLPIWTRRSVPVQAHVETIEFDRPQRIIPTIPVDNTPRPTRFDWPDQEEEPSNPLTGTFEDISYETKPLLQPKDQIPRPPVPVPVTPTPPPPPQQTASFEDVLRSATKRPNSTIIQPDSKRARTLDLQDVKEYVEETQVRNSLLDTEDSDEDVDGDLEADDCDDSYHTTPHKSILKGPDVPTTPTSKRVRFSLDEGSPDQAELHTVDGKENTASPSRALPTRAEDSSPSSVTNHAKIITEVLKKYPHLVANNKNIRLKIMQRGGPGTAPSVEGKASKAKVSYVVLKSDVKGSKTGESPVIHGGQRVITGAQNVTGPWLCHTCGSNDNPLNFESYYLYRRHLQDVHMEKIDARICEHCGHRASKRNLLLYHLYTKHGVVPPRNCQFPKCDQCEYVALSESLLIKHRHNHSNNREFVCRVCNATFKSNGALQGHMQTNLHSHPSKRLYECPYCQKPFIRNINLKAHIRVSHREARGVDDIEGDEVEAEEGQVMEVPVINMVTQSGMTVLASGPTSLEPSSEAEALTNVASGIAASLGLTDQQTVILLDENQEFIIHTGEVIGNDQYIQDGVQEAQEVHEYIVPEIINEDQQQQTQESVNVETEQTEQYTEQNEDQYLDQSEDQYPETEGEQYTDGPPVSSTEEVFMVLTDHCYAEGDGGGQVVTTQEEQPQEEKQVLQEYYVASDNIEQVLASFEEEAPPPPSPTVKPVTPETVIINRRLKPASEPKVPLTVGMKTYSPPKKPLTSNKVPLVKAPVVMTNLLDDWDEESSQEGNNPDDRLPEALPTRSEVLQAKEDTLPTRGDMEYFNPPISMKSEELSHSVDGQIMDVPKDEEPSFVDGTTLEIPVTQDDSQNTSREEVFEIMEVDENTQFLPSDDTDQSSSNAAQEEPSVKESDEGTTSFQESGEDALFVENQASPLKVETEDTETKNNPPSLLPEPQRQQLPIEKETENIPIVSVILENHDHSSPFATSEQEKEQEKTLVGEIEQDKVAEALTVVIDDQGSSLPVVNEADIVKEELLSDRVGSGDTPPKAE